MAKEKVVNINDKKPNEPHKKKPSKCVKNREIMQQTLWANNKYNWEQKNKKRGFVALKGCVSIEIDRNRQKGGRAGTDRFAH